MRVLHLIDAGFSPPCCSTLALLAQSLGRIGSCTHQQAWLLGGGAMAAAGKAAGLDGPEAHRLGVPFGCAMLGYPAVRAHLGIKLGRSAGMFDLVHAWSGHPLGSATLAAALFPKTPRVVTLATPPTRRQVHFLRFLTRESQGRTVLLPASATIRRALLTGGVPEEAVHVLRPGLDMGLPPHAARQEIRRGWGIESDGVKVVALLSDPAQAADAVAAVMAVGLAAEVHTLSGKSAGPEFRLLVHPNQHNRARAAGICRDLRQPGRLIAEPRLATPWAILPACDVALALGPDAGGLSLLWAMAANVPIVGEATYAVSEVVEDRHSALLAKPGEARALAHRITQVVTDPQLAWKLRDTARHEAYSFFSRQRYVQSLETVYKQAVSAQPIEVPPMQVTGGLRFSGRA